MQNPLAAEEETTIVRVLKPIDPHEAKFWADYYKEVFGWDTDFTRLMVFNDGQKKRWPLILMHERLSQNPQEVFDVLAHAGYPLCCSFEKKINDMVPRHQRLGEYGFYSMYGNGMKKTTMADELNKRLPQGTTLSEQLILGHVFYRETGELPSSEEMVLCVGSRDAPGDGIPVVRRVDNRVTIFIVGSNFDDSSLGFKEVIA